MRILGPAPTCAPYTRRAMPERGERRRVGDRRSGLLWALRVPPRFLGVAAAQRAGRMGRAARHEAVPRDHHLRGLRHDPARPQAFRDRAAHGRLHGGSGARRRAVPAPLEHGPARARAVPEPLECAVHAAHARGETGRRRRDRRRRAGARGRAERDRFRGVGLRDRAARRDRRDARHPARRLAARLQSLQHAAGCRRSGVPAGCLGRRDRRARAARVRRLLRAAVERASAGAAERLHHGAGERGGGRRAHSRVGAPVLSTCS